MAIEGWKLEVDEDKLYVHPKAKSMPIEWIKAAKFFQN